MEHLNLVVSNWHCLPLPLGPETHGGVAKLHRIPLFIERVLGSAFFMGWQADWTNAPATTRQGFKASAFEEMKWHCLAAKNRTAKKVLA